MPVSIVVVLLIFALGVLAVLVAGRRGLMRARSRQRVFEAAGDDDRAPRFDPEEHQGALARWLFLAGFRAPGAAVVFVSLNLLCFGVGAVAAYVLISTGTIEQSARLLSPIPGAVNDLFSAFVYASPWLLLAILTALPTLIVRDARNRRVRQFEQDLPVFLELLSTLSEAGLGFDAALSRLLDAEPPDHVLTTEFRTFQLEVLAGRPRVHCLRRLARRLDVTSLSTFVSALVQAEQVGSGVADVLRRQADDLRDRRRERAIALASSLPVKLLFPLVICFLPAIFVITLGPVFYQLFQTVESLFHTTPAGR